MAWLTSVNASIVQAPVTSSFSFVVFDWESIPLLCCPCHLLSAFIFDCSTLKQQWWQARLLCRFNNSLHHWTTPVCRKFYRFALECISKVGLLLFNSPWTGTVSVDEHKAEEIKTLFVEIRSLSIVTCLDFSIVSACIYCIHSCVHNIHVSFLNTKSDIIIAKWDSEHLL